MKKKIVLGITLGDVGGIGPEISVRSAYSDRLPAGLQVVLIGACRAVDETCSAQGLEPPRRWEPGESLPGDPVVLWEPTGAGRARTACGRPTKAAGRAAAEWITGAAWAALEGHLDGIVTAPVSKEGFALAGVPFPGHTEFLASLTGTRDFAMMLMGGGLRVTVVTRHVPLARVARLITEDAIVKAVRITGRGLEWLGVRNRRMVLCGLNPHAGDGGVIGGEETSIILPAIRTLKREGWDIEGPVPADTVFHRARRGEYGAVLAMYHDQGLGPLKTVAFDTGVNVTLGLPIVRTSPDHGTAYDIAGKGVADCRSMLNAIAAARKMASRRNPFVE